MRVVPYGWILGAAFAIGMFVGWGSHTYAFFRMGSLSILVVAFGVGEAAWRGKSELRAPAGVVVAGLLTLLAFFVILLATVLSPDLLSGSRVEFLWLEAGPTLAVALISALLFLARRRGWYREFAAGPPASTRAARIADSLCAAVAAIGWLYLLVPTIAGVAGAALRLSDEFVIASLALMAASSLGLFVGVLRGGRYRKPAAFANALFLVVTAALWDLVLSPRC